MRIANVSVNHMQLLSNQLDETYLNMRTERQALSQWEDDKDFSILGVLELFSSDIQGYIESLLADQLTANADEALEHLRKLDAFTLDYFTAWYFENWQIYPQSRQYVEQLDHLRLLFVEHFSTKIPIAA